MLDKHALQDLVYRTTSPLLVGAELQIRSGGCGLFGDFFMALDGLLFCERFGLRGRPIWDERCLYYDEDRGDNAWDYFFEPPPIPQGKAWATLPYFPSARHFHPAGSVSARRVAALAVERYGRPREHLIEKARTFLHQELRGGDYIAVHVRGTDATSGHEGRANVGPEHYTQVVWRALARSPDSLVFLATDESDVVEAFREHFGSRLRVRDCIRSGDGRSVHGHYDEGQPGSPAQKGEEVVIDALLLAWGKHLIRGHSRVTMYSLALRPELSFDDVDLLAGEPARTPWLYS